MAPHWVVIGLGYALLTKYTRQATYPTDPNTQCFKQPNLIPLGTYVGNGFITVVQNEDKRGLQLNDEFNTYALVFSVGPDDEMNLGSPGGMSPPINTDGLGQVISPSLTDDLGRTKSNHQIHEKEPVCQVNCFIFANQAQLKPYYSIQA